jgi:hypothetical protein
MPLPKSSNTYEYQLKRKLWVKSAEMMFNSSFLLLPEVVFAVSRIRPDNINGFMQIYERNLHWLSFKGFVESWILGLFYVNYIYRCWYGPLSSERFKKSGEVLQKRDKVITKTRQRKIHPYQPIKRYIRWSNRSLPWRLNFNKNLEKWWFVDTVSSVRYQLHFRSINKLIHKPNLPTLKGYKMKL